MVSEVEVAVTGGAGGGGGRCTATSSTGDDGDGACSSYIEKAKMIKWMSAHQGTPP